MDYKMLAYAFDILPDTSFKVGTKYDIMFKDDFIYNNRTEDELPMCYPVKASVKGLIVDLLEGKKLKYHYSSYSSNTTFDFSKLCASLGIPLGENFLLEGSDSVYVAKECLYLNGIALPKTGDNSLASFIEEFFKKELKFKLERGIN